MMVKTCAPLRILCDGMKGENFWLHGCLTYAAACLGLDEQYNYQFFNCYSGDSVTQVFSKDPCVEVQSFSHECTAEVLERCFHAIGYSYTYVPGITNQTDWLPQIYAALDQGLPVLARTYGKSAERTNEFNCIVGYEGNTLLYLFCNDEQATAVPGHHFNELVFIGSKVSAPIPIDIGYQDALHRVPQLLTRASTKRLSFGVQAFVDWASQLTDGSLSMVPTEKMTSWGIHGTYLCMLGSNGRGFGLFEKVQQFFPEMHWLHELFPLYDELSEIFHTLAYRDGGLCGGFNMTVEAAQNPKQMQSIHDLVLQAAHLTQCIADIIQNNIQ